MCKKFDLEKGEKYALNSFPCAIVNKFPEDVQIDSNVWLKRTFPFEMDKDWVESLGTYSIKGIRNSEFFVIAKRASNSPESLDGDNEALKKEVNFYFKAIVLLDFFKFRDYYYYQLTGANTDKIDVRSVVVNPRPIDIEGAPRIKFSEKHVKLVSQIANSLKKLKAANKHSRFFRSLNSFWNGIYNSFFSDKFHQYIRCVEGFILPETRNATKQFASRSELFLGRKNYEFASELYKLRCAVEHLYDPLSLINKVNSESSETIFCKKAIEAEGLARYCLLRFLSNEKLWEHFQDDIHLKNFWELSEDARQKLWGKSLDIKQINKGMLTIFD